MAPTRCTYSGCPGPPKHIVSAAKLKLHTPTRVPFLIQKQSAKRESQLPASPPTCFVRRFFIGLILFACVIATSLAMCTNLRTLPMLAENRITSCAEDFGQRPLTNNIVTLHLPGHYFGRSMATHKNNDQFSPLGGKWTMANFPTHPEYGPGKRPHFWRTQRHSTGRRGLRPTTTYEQHRHFIPAWPLFWPEHGNSQKQRSVQPSGW